MVPKRSRYLAQQGDLQPDVDRVYRRMIGVENCPYEVLLMRPAIFLTVRSQTLMVCVQ
jgi:hypothetical protein